MLEKIRKRTLREIPPPGVYGFLSEKAPDGTEYIKSKFTELPISPNTQQALTNHGFTTMTPVQRSTIPHALGGRDILGTAMTGSGKTLSFLIPALERLYREQWNMMDGLGVLIIEPTRELALQVFDVLRVVGERHGFSAGLVIGGKDFEEEAEKIAQMNILITTPGRLLQHMQETPYFNADNLKILVIDEVDRIMDLGFAQSINSVMTYLPASRQTLLFSATLSKSIQELSRLALKSPEYINIYSKSDTDQVGTPTQLLQSYTIVDVAEKLNLLYNFVKTHLKQKTLIFFSSCKQVRFAFELFTTLRPGVPVMEIHGQQKQSKRTYMYYRFQQETAAVMFCTDILSRGVDFPEVNWVIQADCPEDVSAYVHRVGRTARYKSKGVSMLFLLPHETAFLDLLAARNIECRLAKFNNRLNIQGKARMVIYRRADIRHLAEKYFENYLKAISLMPNKEIFDVRKIDFDGLARSLGLDNTPRIALGEEVLQAGEGVKKTKLQKFKDKIAAKKAEKARLLAEESGQATDDASVKARRMLLKRKIKKLRFLVKPGVSPIIESI